MKLVFGMAKKYYFRYVLRLRRSTIVNYYYYFPQYNGGWWDTAKMLWRYGYMSPKRTETLYESTPSAQFFVTDFGIVFKT